MWNQHAKHKKRLLKEKLLWRKREDHRLARLNKTYNPNKEIVIPNAVTRNEDFKIAAPSKGTRRLEAPSKLNFNEQIHETISYLQQIKLELLFGENAAVYLDLTKVDEISPEAALVLLAELTRGVYYTEKKKKIGGNYPRGDIASEMLTKIGFFKIFQIKTPQFKRSSDPRIYFKAVFGNQSDGRRTQPLTRLLDYVEGLPPLLSKKLYAALIECMDNVKAHAYPPSPTPRPDLIGEWWMAGFIDPSIQQLAIVFYDQGVGIPTTIKELRSIRFKSYISLSDERIIRKAILTGLSRKKSGRRGSGLPSLREIVDVAPGGFLRVVSNEGDFTYCKNSRHRSTPLSSKFDGSLIIWSIQGTLDAPTRNFDLSIPEPDRQLMLNI